MTKILKLSLLLVIFCFASPVSAQAHKHPGHRYHQSHHLKKHRAKKLSGSIITPIEPTPPPTPMPLTMVGSCSTGPETLCPSTLEFPWYGNNEIGDCQFAAAADWEILTLGITPPESEVLEAYSKSGNELWPYWESHTLGGVKATLSHDAYGPQKTVRVTIVNGVTSSTETLDNPLQNDALMRSLIAQNKAIYVVLNLSPELHAVVASGYTPTGPLLATWGHTYQITRQAWNEYALSVETLVRQ